MTEFAYEEGRWEQVTPRTQHARQVRGATIISGLARAQFQPSPSLIELDAIIESATLDVP